ncbi:MAG: GNAT family N-acetyltransferase [Acidobacteriia bacterium]|nr:GNAT family N-acetyltransferase [Terriglobia bacterium]
MEFLIEPMTPADWPQVAAIYRQGIDDGDSTFETSVPSQQVWDELHLPICRLIVRSDEKVLGWAALSAVSRRQCYRGVAEVSVYVAREARGQGIGKALLDRIIKDSEVEGIWTLQGATFEENTASLRLQEGCGFRIVGRRERIGQLNGRWRTTVLTERRSKKVGGE